MSKVTVKKNDGDVFWKQTWRNFFHTLGMIAVVAAIVAVGVLVWKTFFSSSSTYDERKAQRELFQKVVMQAQHPCAIKEQGAKFSNLKECTLFRLRPGMGSSEVIAVINSSGYFKDRAYLHDPNFGKDYCDKNEDPTNAAYCRYYVYSSNPALSVSVHFDDRWAAARDVTLVFEDAAHPYFEPRSMRGLFVKLIGQPDSSSSDDDFWGHADDNEKWSIHAYTHQNEYWVIFKAGPPKKEGAAAAAK